MRDRSASARSVPARTDIAMLSMTIPKTHQATGELRFLTQSLSDNLPQPNHPKPVCGISPLVSTPSELSVDLAGRQPDAATSANGDHANTTITHWMSPHVVRSRQAVLDRWSHRYPDHCLSAGDVAIIDCLWAEGPREQSTGAFSPVETRMAQGMRPVGSREIQS